VNRIFFLLLFQLLIARSVSAQVNDSTKLDTIRHTDQKDSTVITVTSTHKMDAAINKDTSALAQAADSTINTARKQIKVVPLLPESAKKNFQGKELQFYLLVILLLIYGMLKRAFPKYFNDLFRLFFRTTIKQLQVREQLMQTPLPSLLLNIFFVIKEIVANQVYIIINRGSQQKESTSVNAPLTVVNTLRRPLSHVRSRGLTSP